jgi:23S rRNA U2552 (ribose-2'-O)-methylase RlmE/FtsJ
MSEPFDVFRESVAWVADTGLFIACGRQQNTKYTALEQYAGQNDLRFVIPQRVYDELGGAPDRSTPGQTPINSAIDSGWVTVADEPDYTNSTVSQVMDDVQSFIARSSNRDEDRIEKADTALAAIAVELLQGDSEFVCVVTTDIDAGEGVVASLEANGFENRAQFKNGFELINEIT